MSFRSGALASQRDYYFTSYTGLWLDYDNLSA